MSVALKSSPYFYFRFDGFVSHIFSASKFISFHIYPGRELIRFADCRLSKLAGVYFLAVIFRITGFYQL